MTMFAHDFLSSKMYKEGILIPESRRKCPMATNKFFFKTRSNNITRKPKNIPPHMSSHSNFYPPPPRQGRSYIQITQNQTNQIKHPTKPSVV